MNQSVNINPEHPEREAIFTSINSICDILGIEKAEKLCRGFITTSGVSEWDFFSHFHSQHTSDEEEWTRCYVLYSKNEKYLIALWKIDSPELENHYRVFELDELLRNQQIASQIQRIQEIEKAHRFDSWIHYTGEDQSIHQILNM